MTLTTDLYRTVVINQGSQQISRRAWALTLHNIVSLINNVIKQYICFYNLYIAKGLETKDIYLREVW